MPAPQLTKISPQEVTIGATTAMTLSGVGLTGATLVVPGGDTAASIVVVSDTSITFNLGIPAGKSAGARFVQVTTALGVSNKLQINYQGNITDGNLATMEQNYPLDYLHTGA